MQPVRDYYAVKKLRQLLQLFSLYVIFLLGGNEMLTYFTVKNFKGFKDELVFDLSNTKNYEFSSSAIKNGIVSKALIYGPNGCGKSNLGLAIFDLVLHLTDKEKLFKNYPVYLNLDSDEKYASFSYNFVFSDVCVKYNYTKYDLQKLRTEELIINDQIVLYFDFDNDEGYSLLEGTESLRLSSPDSKLSKLKFIYNNAILANNLTNTVFEEMMNFVDRMLLFYSLMDRGYQGLVMGYDILDDAIVKAGKLPEFESFLHKAGINERLKSRDINGQHEIGFQYKNGTIPFNQVASTGTKSLELFFYWYLKMSQASFVFIDEFDAFYHYELAELIINELLNHEDIQVILSTHNTDLISNDLLRPDCYFNMGDNKIQSLSTLTYKELRKAHNIQKMYKAGAFNAD